ncbi:MULTISPECIES: glucodextranase DOMON-like domain-containing protein [Actinomyces]|uniref:Family 49 glycosyl hydrolase n=1 Tax=Actinomyces respiraculi TaxID=2744574 RepID=A0A7T0LJ05_9ACTO|nr:MULTISPECIES: glucodextranase DOMON-like domain-containing protein [Actinomyces]QPL04639.1 family 49 glycosyl hydrolase [Actinomyces respiraculi]
MLDQFIPSAALRAGIALLACATVLTGCQRPAPGPADPTLQAPTVSTTAASSAAPTPGADSQAGPVRTWTHDNAVKNADSAIAEDQVRQSPFYTVRVAPADSPENMSESFTYLSIPRNGEGKHGYTSEDGADFASNAGATMSWSTFEQSADAVVEVSLNTGATISSLDEVTIRPASLRLHTTLVDENTIRIEVPASEAGVRISVEFAPELMTVYANASTGLATQADGNVPIETEPRNALLIFAQPPAPAGTVPTAADGSLEYVEPGQVTDLDSTTAEILYFGPGTYWMGSNYRALLPENVRWVYLAPGAFVKGAFRFADPADPVGGGQSDYRVTGYGVLSGEQYPYESDTANNYQRKDPKADNCHATCVKMLQFGSSDAEQHLELQGITIKEPPYHSFVVYGNEDTFRMDVSNYQQVGGWYWQTDGIEMYSGSTMSHTFFHANDDVLKLYHSGVNVNDTVVWKNENGPVIQWGWTPRNIDGVNVDSTAVIHNRMYSGGVGYNTCVFNSSTHWQDMGSRTTADPATTVRNMRFTNTTVEGGVNCAMRIYALSDMENIEIDGFHIDSWGGQSPYLQQSVLTLLTNTDGEPVTLGNEVTDRNGLYLHNYTVGGEAILKAGENWASHETGRLNFDAETWDGWNAEADGQPQGPAPALTVVGLTDGATLTSRQVGLTGTTDAARVAITVNGEQQEVPISHGCFNARLRLPDVTNWVRVVAYSETGTVSVRRYMVQAFGDLVGSLEDPRGDDNGPGSYTYPTDSAFSPGGFDLTAMKVYRDGGVVRFVTTLASDVTNPWGANGMSTQRLNLYLRDATATDTEVTALLAGTNTFASGAWDYVVVADGRNEGSTFGPGIYDAAGQRVGDVTLTVTGPYIIASVNAEVLEGLDLARAGYQVSLYSSAEDSESVGNVRPVYSAACFSAQTCEDWVAKYRFGGGRGELTEHSPYDTDLADSNAIDMITGDAAQAEVMDLSQERVVAPYVGLTAPDSQ